MNTARSNSDHTEPCSRPSHGCPEAMKTFIVYNLDMGLPIAVGEAIKAEWARVKAAEETNIRAENLIAEEIDLGKEFELL